LEPLLIIISYSINKMEVNVEKTSASPAAKDDDNSKTNGKTKKRKPGDRELTQTTCAPWQKFLKTYAADHPELSRGDALIEARKRYIGPKGKKKSFERIYREAWLAYHPSLEMAREELNANVRKDFIEKLTRANF